MGTWEIKIEFERNNKFAYIYHKVGANDIYSALTEITYYIDHGMIDYPAGFDYEDGSNVAVIEIALLA